MGDLETETEPLLLDGASDVRHDSNDTRREDGVDDDSDQSHSNRQRIHSSSSSSSPPPSFSHPLRPMPQPVLSQTMWSNSQPIGANVAVSETGLIEREPESDVDPLVRPTAAIFNGPTRVEIPRESSGFGFTIGGSAPVHVVSVDASGPAVDQGVKPGFRLLEVEDVDVTTSSLDVVSGLIQGAREVVHLVVIPGTLDSQSEWGNPFEVFGLQQPARDPTSAPPSNLKVALLSSFCCPCIGLMAVHHAMLSRIAWQRNRYSEAVTRSVMSRKLSASAFFYGMIFLVMFLFVRLSKRHES